jgi:hypothetical protein
MKKVFVTIRDLFGLFMCVTLFIIVFVLVIFEAPIFKLLTNYQLPRNKVWFEVCPLSGSLWKTVVWLNERITIFGPNSPYQTDEELLQEVLDNEEYEEAAVIRDRMAKRNLKGIKDRHRQINDLRDRNRDKDRQ